MRGTLSSFPFIFFATILLSHSVRCKNCTAVTHRCVGIFFHPTVFYTCNFWQSNSRADLQNKISDGKMETLAMHIARLPENVNLVDLARVNGVQAQNHTRNAPDDCYETLPFKIKLLGKKGWKKYTIRSQDDKILTVKKTSQSEAIKVSFQTRKSSVLSIMNRSPGVCVNNWPRSMDFSNHFKCEKCNYFELIRDTFWLFKYSVTWVEVGNAWIKHDLPVAPVGLKTIATHPEPTSWRRTRLKKDSPRKKNLHLLKAILNF